MNLNLRDRIIRRASELFASRGIKTITMDFIAAEMGISKRTLYEQFGDKDTLLLETVKYSEHIQKLDRERLRNTTSDYFEAYLTIYKRSLALLREVNPNYLSDLRRYHPQVAAYLDQRMDEDMRDSVAMTERGIREGLIRPELNAQILALLLKAQLEMLTSPEGLHRYPFTMAELFETIIINYARGIATPKGLAMLETFIAREKNAEHAMDLKKER